MKKAPVSTPFVPTTWRRDHVVHEVTYVLYNGPTFADKHRWTFRTACGRYETVDDGRAFKPGRPVGCMACITQENFVLSGYGNHIRGLTADHVIIDEIQDFDYTKDGHAEPDQ